MYTISAEFMYLTVIDAIGNYSAVENGFNSMHRWALDVGVELEHLQLPSEQAV
jgi:hypothetical protein